jgi:hypothetical protein
LQRSSKTKLLFSFKTSFSSIFSFSSKTISHFYDYWVLELFNAWYSWGNILDNHTSFVSLFNSLLFGLFISQHFVFMGRDIIKLLDRSRKGFFLLCQDNKT